MQTKLPFKPIKITNNITLNVWTWNINCIKNKIAFINHLLMQHDIDILCVTETKIQSKDENIIFDNYNCIWNSNKNSNYHGIAMIYKCHLNIITISTILPSTSQYHFNNIKLSYNSDIIEKYLPTIGGEIVKGHNTEGRILVLKLEIHNTSIVLVGTYVPNSGVNKNEPLKRLAYRTLAWDKDLCCYLNQLREEYKNVIWLGDLNVIIKDNDIGKKSNIAGATIEERTNIKEFMTEWIDTWDVKNNIKKCALRATWCGKYPLRLDYVICSQSLKNNIVSSMVDQTTTCSDHYPIGSKFSV